MYCSSDFESLIVLHVPTEICGLFPIFQDKLGVAIISTKGGTIYPGVGIRMAETPKCWLKFQHVQPLLKVCSTSRVNTK